MIRLRAHLRLFATVATDGARQRWLEAVVAERAVPLSEPLHLVLRALARGPVDGSAELMARIQHLDDGSGSTVQRGAVHGALSVLKGLELLDVGEESATSMAATASLWDRLAADTSALPVIDQVELTNHCPMSCIMCPTGTGRMTRPRGFMEQALFARIVDEAAAGPRTKPLTLHNLGESLLHPGLPAFVALATSRGVTTELSANPGHLSPERYQALEDAGLGRLVLDVDGLDQQTLESIRGPGARGDRAFGWLDAVLDHRRRHRRQFPHIVLQMIRQRQNAHQHEAFLEKYGAMGIEGVDAYLKEVDANTVETSAAGGLPIFVEHRPRRPYLCRAPWRSVVVLFDGSVVPCCHDENGRVVLGNLSSQSLAEIWSGPEVAALRERLLTNSLMADEPCATCAHRADRYPLPDLDDVAVEPLHW